jgi:hypothetical protein
MYYTKKKIKIKILFKEKTMIGPTLKKGVYFLILQVHNIKKENGLLIIRIIIDFIISKMHYANKN